MTDSTRPSLLLAIRNANDRKAWGEFSDIYSPVILSHYRRRNLQEADAQEVVQRVLTVVFQTIARFEYQKERGGFRGWLYRVTNHEITHYLAELKKAGQGVGGHDDGSWLEREADTEWMHDCQACVLD